MEELEGDFFLGNDDDYISQNSENFSEEFFLGNDEEDNKNSIFDESKFQNNKKNKLSIVREQSKNVEIKNDEIDEVYALLHIDEIPLTMKAEEYIKHNPDIFKIIKKIIKIPYYGVVNENDFKLIEKKCDNWILEADNKWRIKSISKVEKFQNSITALKNYFHYPEQTRLYNDQMKKILSGSITPLFDKACSDGIIENSELLEILNVAKNIHLINDSKNEKQNFLDEKINSLKEKNVKIENFEETFIRYSCKKEKFDLIDCDQNREKLFEEYVNYYNDQVLVFDNEKKSKSVLKQMFNLCLDTHKILIEKKSFYDENFFIKEKNKNRYNFSLALNSEYFYYLKETAKNLYYFSELDWKEFSEQKKLILEDFGMPVFILGKNKASSLKDVAKIIVENPSLSKSRIKAGDLETFLFHIGKIDLAKKIANCLESNSENDDEVIQKISSILNDEKVNEIKFESEIETKNEIINANSNCDDDIFKTHFLDELIKNVLEKKSNENWNEKFLHDKKLEEYLSKNFYSVTQFLLNYLNLFLQESDCEEYRFIFVLYAKRTFEILIQENNFFAFNYIFLEIIQRAKNFSILNSNDNEFLEKIETEKNRFLELEKSQETIFENKILKNVIQKNLIKNKFLHKFFRGSK